MTRAIAGIQARMGSTRLPGKSLADLAGKPMLQRIVERANAAKLLDSVVVLTSSSDCDEAISSFCNEVGIACRRGPEQDVMQRYLDLVDEFDADYLVRITGDCPFISPEHIDWQLEALRETDTDFTALPPGLSSTALEGQGAFSVRALRSASASQDPRDREHVGSFYFAAHAHQFRTVELHCDPALLRSDLRLSVDEQADLELARAVYDQFAPGHDSLAPLLEVLAWLDSNPLVSQLNRRISDSPDTRQAHQKSQQAERRVVASWPPHPT